MMLWDYMLCLQYCLYDIRDSALHACLGSALIAGSPLLGSERSSPGPSIWYYLEYLGFLWDFLDKIFPKYSPSLDI